MVALNSSRRKPSRDSSPSSVIGALSKAGNLPMESLFCNAASHRAERRVVIYRTPDGSIREVQIGRWRVVTASAQRRLCEVRELSCGRVAVRIEHPAQGCASSEYWQLYDPDGRLDAAMQVAPDGKFAILTNYRTRQARRLMADGEGALRVVETWTI